jgi:hypothetical protein
MFTSLGNSSLSHSCIEEDQTYELTDTLDFNRSRTTRYYAIAGIDCAISSANSNSQVLELSTTNASFLELSADLYVKGGEFLRMFGIETPLDVKVVKDNLVTFLSQIGWSEGVIAPVNIIPMYKICVLIDSNGQHGYVDLAFGGNILHNKIPKRFEVFQKVYSYLIEN